MIRPVPVITIDGPSGSGKGTVAALLAGKLGWNFLDSGALYRLLGAVGHCSNHCFAFIAVGSGNSVRKLCKCRTYSTAVLGARPASRQSSSNSSSRDFQCGVMCLVIA